MFQYAIYRKLMFMGFDCLIDDREIEEKGNQHNGLELKRVFGVEYKRVDLYVSLYIKYYRMLDAVKRRIHHDDKRRHILIDDQRRGLSELTDPKYKYLDGFWQNGVFFQDIRKMLLKDYEFKLPVDDSKNKGIYQEIITGNSVGIHIRRGDYLQHRDIVFMCPHEYYHRGIDLIKDRYPGCKLYFFSDDIEWTKNNFKDCENAVYVDWNTGINSYLDMWLMSKCKHNIISASTFSWWSAWLNTNPGKMVICPTSWYKKIDVNPSLEEWIHLK